ncbi:MAG TPA: hypothetical protein VHE99_07875 [Gammaproteobacteria bacterium]|nr:hypothetical protein [Gammaproteobacteria bacterium]
MNMQVQYLSGQVQYLSDKQLANLSGGLSLFQSRRTPGSKTIGSSTGSQRGNHNIQIVQNGVASNGGTVVQVANIYTAPVTINYNNSVTFRF